LSDSTVIKDDSKVLVCSCPNPFTTERIDHAFIEGMTIQQILETIHMPDHVSYLVSIGGVPVLPENYANVVPAAGSYISIRAVPTGGGGDKNIFRTILTVVVVVVAAVAAAYTGGASLGLLGATGSSVAGALAGAAVMTVGMLLVNAICPPPSGALANVGGISGAFSGGSVSGSGASSAAAKPSYALSGAGNSLAPYGPIPMLLGRHRISPPYGARPYTTNEGDDQYMHCIFCEGFGVLHMVDHRFGETSVNSFDDIEMEVLDGSSLANSLLFPGDVFQQDESIVLKEVDGWAMRETQPNVNRVSVDITYPNGLLELNDDGSTDRLTGLVDIQYRLKGTEEWIGEVHEVEL